MKARTRRFTGKVEFERDFMCVSNFPLGRKGKQIVSNPSPLPMVDIIIDQRRFWLSLKVALYL